MDVVVGGVKEEAVVCINPSSAADVESETYSSISSGSLVQCPKCGGAEDDDSAGNRG